MDRLSAYQIPDCFYRGALYKEILNQSPYMGDEHWYAHTVQPGYEELNPDLIAYRVYNSAELKWVVLIAGRLNDYRELLPAGTKLMLPSQEWLRERIRYYRDQAEINVEPEPLKILAQPAAEQGEPPPIPTDDPFLAALDDSLNALPNGIPLVRESDKISDESLNRQRHAIQKKLDSMDAVLSRLRR
ncbi:MAG: hypothetical protein OIF57_08725 [Marinobacterium sp.]|nr:hypothetical protein [Marinobacterium sp.]